MWVDRLRACAYMHNEAIAHNTSLSLREKRPQTPPGSRSHFSNGEPSDQLQNLSLSVLDAFGSVHDILNKVDKKHQALADTIEELPVRRPGDPGDTPSCHDDKLLQLKATSAAVVRSMETALAILQQLRGHELEPPVVVHQSIPLPTAFSVSQHPSVNLLPGSPSHLNSHRSVSSLSIPSTPARTKNNRPKSADIMSRLHN